MLMRGVKVYSPDSSQREKPLDDKPIPDVPDIPDIPVLPPQEDTYHIGRLYGTPDASGRYSMSDRIM